MPSYLITYDLTKPNRNYSALYDAIKGLSGTWAHVTESSWVVVGTNLTSITIRDTLAASIDNNDEIFIAKLSGEAAWRGLSTDQTEWLKKHI